MNLKLKDSRRKELGIKRFFNSFKYNIEGIKYSLINEQSFIIESIIAILVIIFGFVFKISVTEWIVVLLLIANVLCSELINTAIEAAIDLSTTERHPLAKIAKDTASAAVGIYALISFIIGLIIFLPKVIGLFF